MRDQPAKIEAQPNVEVGGIQGGYPKEEAGPVDALHINR